MSKKISSASIDKIIQAKKKEPVSVSIIAGDINIEVVITPDISYKERCQMINDIVEYCYDENGKYHPEFFDIAYKITLLEYYTNINTDIKDAVDKMYHLCKVTNIIDLIYQATSNEAIDILSNAQDVIRWRNEQSLKASAWDDVAKIISDILDKLENKIEAMPEMNQEEVSKLMGTVSKLGNMSEDKIVEGILKLHNKEN